MKRIKRYATHKFSRFFYGGLVNYGLKIGITAALTELFHLWYFASYVIALFFVTIFGFYYSMHVTYKVTLNKRRNFVKYCIAISFFILMDAMLVKFATEVLMVHYLVSIVVITGVIFVAKYFVYDLMVFTKRPL